MTYLRIDATGRDGIFSQSIAGPIVYQKTLQESEEGSQVLKSMLVSGFSALPSGWRRSTGIFTEIVQKAPFWTGVNFSIDTGLDFVADYSSSVLNVRSSNKKDGFLIRCLKD